MTFLYEKVAVAILSKSKKSKFSRDNSAHWESVDIYISRYETLSAAYTQSCDKHDKNLADRYLTKTLQIKLKQKQNKKVELTCIAVVTLKSSVDTNCKYWKSVGELKNKFVLPEVDDTCRIINNNLFQLQTGILKHVVE